ncbi:MAG: TolC family outer membrane protein [Paracoccaceae bacterium]
MTRRIFILPLVTLVLSFGLVGAVRAETLTDALVSAYKNSGLLEQNRALLRAADEDVAQSVASLRPVINYAIGANYSSITDATTSNLQLSANMMLFDFGRSKLRVEVAEENVLALREALVGIEQNALLGAVRAYVNMQRDTSIVGLRQNNVRLISEELRAAKERFDVGEITRTDVALAQARLAGSNSALSAALGNLAISREEYRANVGHYPRNLAGLPSPPATAGSLETARSIARQNHPDIAQSKHNVRISDLNVAIAAAGIRPSLTGNANVGVNQDGDSSSSFGLSFSGPIYQGGALASAHRKSAARRDASRAGLLLTGLNVDQNVGNAWARLAVANAGLEATGQQIRASRVAFRGVKEEASLGARTTLDVLNAEQELLDAESAQISAQTDRYVAVYSLLAAMGLLTAEHLRLGITTYDPAAYFNAVKNAPSYGVSDQGKRLDSLLKSIGSN